MVSRLGLEPRALASKAPTLQRKINAISLQNLPMSDKHLQRVTVCLSFIRTGACFTDLMFDLRFKVTHVGIIRSLHLAGGYSLNALATPLLTISKFFSKLSPTVSLITARHTNFFSDDSARFTTKVAS